MTETETETETETNTDDSRPGGSHSQATERAERTALDEVPSDGVHDPPSDEATHDGAEPALDPDEGDALMDAADLFVPRDPETDEVLPTEVHIAGYGPAEIRQFNYGEGEKYFGDHGGVADAGPETVAEILRNHVVDPDLEQYAQDTYGEKLREQNRGGAGPPPYLNGHVVREEMEPFAPMALLRAILNESGMPTNSVRVDDDGTATVEFDDEGNE